MRTMLKRATSAIAALLVASALTACSAYAEQAPEYAQVGGASFSNTGHFRIASVYDGSVEVQCTEGSGTLTLRPGEAGRSARELAGAYASQFGGETGVGHALRSGAQWFLVEPMDGCFYLCTDVPDGTLVITGMCLDLDDAAEFFNALKLA